jgi:hypothetical protein
MTLPLGGKGDEIAEAEREVRQAGSNIEAFNAIDKRKHAQDRSLIVKWVMGLYVGSVGVTILYLICRGVFWNEARLPVFSTSSKLQ